MANNANHGTQKTKEEKKPVWLTMDVIKSINAQRQAALDYDIYFPDVSGGNLRDWQKEAMGLS